MRSSGHGSSLLMTSTLSAAYERLVLAHPARVLVVMLAVLGFFAWQARHFELDASADALLLEADRDLQTWRALQARYASKDLLIVTFEPGGDVFEESSLARLRALRDRLREAPGVESAASILDVPLLDNVEGVSLAGIAANLRTLDDPGDRPRPRQAGTAGEPGVRRGHRERRCADRRDPALHARRRGIPHVARGAEPAADAANRGRRPRRHRPRRARTHRGHLRNGEAPRRRAPAGRNRGDPRRARGVRRRRHAAPRRRADDRRRHDHLHTQRPRRVRDRGGGVPRDRPQRNLPRGALGRAAARGLCLRRPADDRRARAHGMEGHGDLVELPGPDAHHHHLDEHPPHGTLPPAPPRFSRPFPPRARRRHGAADGLALPVYRAHHHHRLRLAGVQRHQAGDRLRLDDEHRARGHVRHRVHPLSRHRAADRTRPQPRAAQRRRGCGSPCRP